MNFGVDLKVYSGADFQWPETKKLDLVFFGDGPVHIFNSWFWPKGKKVRLWVLSETHRKVIAHFLGVPTRNIGLIQLKNKHSKAKIDQKAENIFNNTPIVIATRIIKPKNWEASINLALGLRKFQKSNREIHFHTPMPCPPRNSEKFLAVKKFIKQGVQFHFGDGEDWWKSYPKNSLFVQLSLDYTEDFGVACFQAEMAGFQLVLSHWGGHLDFSKALYVNPKDILNVLMRNSIFKPAMLIERQMRTNATNHLPPRIDTSSLHRKVLLQKRKLNVIRKVFYNAPDLQNVNSKTVGTISKLMSGGVY